MNHSNISLSSTTEVLHMVIAFSIVVLLAVGIIMSEFELFALYDIHKSVEALVFILAK